MKQTNIPIITNNPKDHGTMHYVSGIPAGKLDTGFTECTLTTVIVPTLGIYVDCYVRTDKSLDDRTRAAKSFIKGYFINGRKEEEKAPQAS